MTASAGTQGLPTAGPSPGGSTPPARRAWGQLMCDYTPSIAFYALVLGVLELLVRLQVVPKFLLPAPSGVAARFVMEFPLLVRHAMRTLEEIALGYGLAVIAGLLLAILITHWRPLERAVYPFALFFQTTPKEAFAPILVVWFGYGIVPKVLITALVSFFPVLINTVAGLKNTDRRLLDLLRILNANGWQAFIKVRFPSAVPLIFSGLKIGITLATIGAIIGEWVVSDAGLGYRVLVAMGLFDLDSLFATLGMIGLVGIGLFGIVDLADRWLSPHRRRLARKDIVVGFRT